MGYSLATVLSLALGYLLGSIPVAVWLSRSVYGVDVRTIGSGNAGSTNMYRSFGFKAGFITQLADILKGVIAASLPVLLLKNEHLVLPLTLTMLGSGLAAVLGHTFPIFAGFRGGKGVNTILGMMLVLHPYGSAVSLLTFAIVLLLGRMVSLASLSAVYAFSLFVAASIWVQQPSGDEYSKSLLFLGIGLLLAVYITWSHRSNIDRIRKGTERRVNLFGSKP